MKKCVESYIMIHNWTTQNSGYILWLTNVRRCWPCILVNRKKRNATMCNYQNRTFWIVSLTSFKTRCLFDKTNIISTFKSVDKQLGKSAWFFRCCSEPVNTAQMSRILAFYLLLVRPCDFTRPTLPCFGVHDQSQTKNQTKKWSMPAGFRRSIGSLS